MPQKIKYTVAQYQALEIAAASLALCYRLNSMDDAYADGHNGPFKHAAQTAKSVLTIAFGLEYTLFIMDSVWNSDDHGVEDLQRYLDLAIEEYG